MTISWHKILSVTRRSNLIWWLVGLAFLLRLPQLNGSLWLDEAAQALESVRPWSQQLQIAADFQPPFYHLVVHWWALLGHQEWWLRLTSLMPALVMMPLLAAHLRRRTDRVVAHTTLLLMATSSLLIYFSQELRPYMWAVAWALMAWICLDRLVTDPGAHPRRWLWGTVGSLTAAWLTSYTTLLLAPIFLIFTWLWRPRWGRLLVRIIMNSVVWWLVWWPGFWQQWLAGHQLQQVLPGWQTVVSPPTMKAGLLVIAKFVVGVVPINFNWRDALIVGLPYLLLGLAYFYWWSRRTPQTETQNWLKAVAGMVVVGFIGSWLATFLVPILAPKRVLFLLPWLLILVAGAARWAGGWGKLALWSFLVWHLVGIAVYWTDINVQRENWRGVIEIINNKFDPQDTTVIFAFNEPFAPWRWYEQSAFPTECTGLTPLSSVADWSPAWPTTQPPTYVVIFDYLRDLTDPHHIIDSALEQNGYNEMGTWSYPQIGQVHIYQQKEIFAWQITQ